MLLCDLLQTEALQINTDQTHEDNVNRENARVERFTKNLVKCHLFIYSIEFESPSGK
jgi:hypothetical protein